MDDLTGNKIDPTTQDRLGKAKTDKIKTRIEQDFPRAHVDAYDIYVTNVKNKLTKVEIRCKLEEREARRKGGFYR